MSYINNLGIILTNGYVRINLGNFKIIKAGSIKTKTHIDGDASKPHNYIFPNVQERQKTHRYPFIF